MSRSADRKPNPSYCCCVSLFGYELAFHWFDGFAVWCFVVCLSPTKYCSTSTRCSMLTYVYLANGRWEESNRVMRVSRQRDFTPKFQQRRIQRQNVRPMLFCPWTHTWSLGTRVANSESVTTAQNVQHVACLTSLATAAVVDFLKTYPLCTHNLLQLRFGLLTSRRVRIHGCIGKPVKRCTTCHFVVKLAQFCIPKVQHVTSLIESSLFGLKATFENLSWFDLHSQQWNILACWCTHHLANWNARKTWRMAWIEVMDHGDWEKRGVFYEMCLNSHKI